MFESGDVTQIQYNIDPTTINPSINQDSVAKNKAIEVFETKDVDTTNIDYSDSIAEATRKSFRITTIPETLDARIARLQREVEEVRQLKEKETQNQSYMLDNLKEVLDKLASSGGGGDLEFYGGLGETLNYKSTDQVKTVEISKAVDKLINLENRLTKLEKQVGFGDDESTTTPIQQSIKNITQKLGLLINSPQEIEKNITKIKSLSNYADKIKNAKEPVPKDEDLFQHRRITSLYNKLNQFDQLQISIPHMLTRLKSLNSVHADATAAVASVQSADATIETIKSEIKNWIQTLNKIESRLKQNDELFEKNKQQLESWIKNLEQRLDG